MQIDTHIPPPTREERYQGRGRQRIYPFAALPVGGSFAVTRERAAAAGNAAKTWKQRHPGWDYRTLKSAGEFRVWRIS